MLAPAKSPLRIAQVAPLYESVPPKAYGGTERVIAGLCDELVELGHDVTLFATATSTTRARLVPMAPEALRLTMTRAELERIAPHLHLRMLSEVFSRADEFDVIHAHTDLWTLPFCGLATAPTVITMHGRLDLPELRATLPSYPNVGLVSISDDQRRALAELDLPWLGTAYNGLQLDPYLDRPNGRGQYLAFLGRITPEKRPDWAVEIARRVGLPLRVAAKIDPLDVDYWTEEIAPLFGAHDVEFLGEIDEAAKPAFLGDAAALLFPIDWPEPFGLVMIEAMAAGTPVVALRRGSVPEVVSHGRSGFVCDDLDGMVDALGHLDEIDEADCRAVARRFTAAAMAARYVDIYTSVLERPRPGATRVTGAIAATSARAA